MVRRRLRPIRIGVVCWDAFVWCRLSSIKVSSTALDIWYQRLCERDMFVRRQGGHHQSSLVKLVNGCYCEEDNDAFTSLVSRSISSLWVLLEYFRWLLVIVWSWLPSSGWTLVAMRMIVQASNSHEHCHCMSLHYCCKPCLQLRHLFQLIVPECVKAFLLIFYRTWCEFFRRFSG